MWFLKLNKRPLFIVAAVILLYVLAFFLARWLAPESAVTRTAFAPFYYIGGGGGEEESVEGVVVKVKAVEVEGVEMTPAIEASGVIEYFEKIDVVSKSSGRIDEIYAQKGETVRVGQKLVQIERLPLELQAAQQKAALDGEEAQLALVKERYENARRDIERRWNQIERQRTQARELKALLERERSSFKGREALYNAGGISREEYETARVTLISREADYLGAKRDLEILSVGFREKDLRQAGLSVPQNDDARYRMYLDLNTREQKAEVRVQEARVRAAAAELQNTYTLLNEATIRSPITGIVAARNKSPGEEVRQGSVATPQEAIMVLVDIDQVYAQVNVKESRAKDVQPGMEFRFTVDTFPDERFKAVVELIDPLVDTKTHTVGVRALLDNPGLKFRPGMFLRGQIVTGEDRIALMVPEKALQPGDSGAAAAFVIRDNRVYRVEVKTGERRDEKVEVTEGLQEGDVIAVEKFSLLRDGMQVEALVERSENNATQSEQTSQE